ncbi:MAG: nucleotide exchange factor GrpE [Lachnospiraceae bacterium]|nr:nucleotide exchange factor GrpE [Lachnospiraceae bacterium]
MPYDEGQNPEETAETVDTEAVKPEESSPEPETEKPEAAKKASDGRDPDRKKKKDKKDRNRPDKRDEEIAALKDKVLRQQAEFVNFRNRTEKEKSQMFEVGAKSMLEKMLPTIDNFERGLAMLTEEQKAEPFAQGMEKTYRQMLAALESAGVKQIEAVGKPFDPNLHNAVMHVEDDSVGENIVVEDFQKGYMYRDTVLRFSMVKVAN